MVECDVVLGGGGRSNDDARQRRFLVKVEQWGVCRVISSRTDLNQETNLWDTIYTRWYREEADVGSLCRNQLAELLQGKATYALLREIVG